MVSWHSFALLFFLDFPSGRHGCCGFCFSPAFIYLYRPNNKSHFWDSWIFSASAYYPHYIMYGIMYDFRVNVQSPTLCINLWASSEKLQNLKGWKAIKGSAVMLKLCHLTPARRDTSTHPLHSCLLKKKNVYIIYSKDLKHNEFCRGEQSACVFHMADCISTASVLLYISAGSF